MYGLILGIKLKICKFNNHFQLFKFFLEKC